MRRRGRAGWYSAAQGKGGAGCGKARLDRVEKHDPRPGPLQGRAWQLGQDAVSAWCPAVPSWFPAVPAWFSDVYSWVTAYLPLLYLPGIMLYPPGFLLYLPSIVL